MTCSLEDKTHNADQSRKKWKYRIQMKQIWHRARYRVNNEVQMRAANQKTEDTHSMVGGMLYTESAECRDQKLEAMYTRTQKTRDHRGTDHKH